MYNAVRQIHPASFSNNQEIAGIVGLNPNLNKMSKTKDQWTDPCKIGVGDTRKPEQTI